MARFLTREAQIPALAALMADGFQNNPATFLSPPGRLGAAQQQAEPEYKVLAINKAGTAPESNTVMAML